MASYPASGSVVNDHKEPEPEPIQGAEDRQEAEEDEEVDEDSDNEDDEEDDEEDDDNSDSDSDDDDDDDDEELAESDRENAADRPRPQRLRLVFRNALGATSTTGHPAPDERPAPGQRSPVRIIHVAETSRSASEPAKDKGKEKEALFDEAAFQKDLLAHEREKWAHERGAWAHEREKWAKERSALLEKVKTMEQESRASFTKGEESAVEYVKKLERQLFDKQMEGQQMLADALSSVGRSQEQLVEKDRQIAEADNQLTAHLTNQRLTHGQAMWAANEEHSRREVALMHAHSAEVQRLQAEILQKQPKSSGSSSEATEPATRQQSDNAEESRADMAAELSKVLEEKRLTEKVIADLRWDLGEVNRALKRKEGDHDREKNRLSNANETLSEAQEELRTAKAAASSLRVEKVALEVEVGRLQLAARVDRGIKGDLRAELRKRDTGFRLVGEPAAPPSTSAVVKKPVVEEAVVKVAAAKETEKGGRGWTPFSGFRGRPTKAFLDPSSFVGRIWCFDLLWFLVFLYLVMAFFGNWDWQMLLGKEEVAWNRVIPVRVIGVPEPLREDPWLVLVQGMYGV